MSIEYYTRLVTDNGEEEIRIMPGEAKKRAIQVGDEYDIPVRVVQIGQPVLVKQYKVQVRNRPDLTDWVCGATLDASTFVKAAERPLAVGDRVRTKNLIAPKDWSAEILCLHEGVAWVKSNYHGYQDYPVDLLERC